MAIGRSKSLLRGGCMAAVLCLAVGTECSAGQLILDPPAGSPAGASARNGSNPASSPDASNAGSGDLESRIGDLEARRAALDRNNASGISVNVQGSVGYEVRAVK